MQKGFSYEIPPNLITAGYCAKVQGRMILYVELVRGK
jgi:hypothetical protein